MRDYNFFEALQKRQKQSFDPKSPAFLGLMAIILILLISGGLFAQKTFLNKSLVKAAGELAEIKSSPVYQEADALQKQIDAMSEYDKHAGDALDRIRQGDILNTKFLKELTQSMPRTAFLENAKIGKEEVFMEFRVANRKVAAELIENINKSGLFIQTSLSSVTSEGEGPGFITAISGIIKAGEEE